MKKLILIFVCVLAISCKKKKIIPNPGYTIATVNYYQPKLNGTHLSDINFGYIINGKSYSKNYDDGYNGWPVPSSGSYNKGSKYMGVYDLNDPNSCRFLFDYSIQDSTGYRYYVNYFKSHPPQ